ncbi:hypothetical protein [Sorangium sp. So ce1024]|uniref:hypothetical protein n=1 Tax=Sorangium sp. So ce1024 TaxID=3133327 RepID=UPI003EFF0AFA
MLDVLRLAACVAPGDLAAIQAHAAEIAAEEIRDAEDRHVGPAVLYYLEQTVILLLVVAGFILRHIEAVEAAGAPVMLRSGGKLRRLLAVKRWHGRLRTLGYAKRRRSDRRTVRRVRCRCACGEMVDVRPTDLLSERTTSCGCRRDELTAARNRERAEQRRAA